VKPRIPLTASPSSAGGTITSPSQAVWMPRQLADAAAGDDPAVLAIESDAPPPLFEPF
jgi:hypothetical protein